MTGFDLLERQPPIRVHEVDQSEVAGGEHRRLGLRRCLLPVAARAGGLLQRVADHGGVLIAGADGGGAP